MIIDSVEKVILIATIIILISRRASLFYLIVILTCWIQILTWRNFRNLKRPTNIPVIEENCSNKYRIALWNNFLDMCLGEL